MGISQEKSVTKVRHAHVPKRDRNKQVIFHAFNCWLDCILIY